MADYETKIQQAKVDAIQELVEEFKDVKDFIFTDYRGLTVEQITDLRLKLREQGAKYKVVKNRFAKIALQELERPAADAYLVGPTAVALPEHEVAPIVKVLLDFSKTVPLMQVKGGIVDGAVFNATEIEAYSKLPSRLELIAKLMGTMNAPAQNVVYVLNAIPTKLVRTLQAVADAKK